MVSARAVRVRMAYLEPSRDDIGRYLTEKECEICFAQEL